MSNILKQKYAISVTIVQYNVFCCTIQTLQGSLGFIIEKHEPQFAQYAFRLNQILHTDLK